MNILPIFPSQGRRVDRYSQAHIQQNALPSPPSRLRSVWFVLSSEGSCGRKSLWQVISIPAGSAYAGVGSRMILFWSPGSIAAPSGRGQAAPGRLSCSERRYTPRDGCASVGVIILFNTQRSSLSWLCFFVLARIWKCWSFTLVSSSSQTLIRGPFKKKGFTWTPLLSIRNEVLLCSVIHYLTGIRDGKKRMLQLIDSSVDLP